MPRTIESIVASHEAATARRKAGRPIWDLTVTIKPLLHESAPEDLTVDGCARIARAIAAELKRKIPEAWRDTAHDNFNLDFEDLLERLEQATSADFEIGKDDFNLEPVNLLDGWLDELYDWADRYRVWVA